MQARRYTGCESTQESHRAPDRVVTSSFPPCVAHPHGRAYSANSPTRHRRPDASPLAFPATLLRSTRTSRCWELRLILTALVLLAAFCLYPSGMRAQDAVLTLSPAPVLTTIAGPNRDDATAASALKLASPSGAVYDLADNLYVSDTRNHRVLRVSAAGEVATVAGNGIQGFGGDNGPATAASLDSPTGLAVSADGTLYIADSHNHRLRRVTPDGVIQTVAGTGTPGFSGDLGPAANAQLRLPTAVALGSLGELYVADTGNHRIRRVALDGSIVTVAGNGTEQATGDGGPATAAGLDAPSGVAFRQSDGSLFIADRLNSRIRVVSPSGTISSLSAASAPVRRAAAVAMDAEDNLLIADTGNYKLRAVMSKGSGVLLGSGEQGTPDPLLGYAATPLGALSGVAPDASGGVAFTDRDHGQVQHFALPQLAFSPTDVGQVSPSKTVALANSGSEALTVASVDIPSAFQRVRGQGCTAPPFTLARGEQCMLVLAFAPGVVGSQSGVLAVNSADLPRRVLLSGTALAPGTLLGSNTLLDGAGSLSYVGTPVAVAAHVLGSGTSTPSGLVHLSDSSTEIATATLGQDGSAIFTTTVLTAGEHSLSATYDGDVHYAGSSSAVLQQVVVLAPDFTVTPTATQMTVKAGATTSMDFVLQPINGTLNQSVTLAFSGVPPGTTVASNAPTPLVLGSNAITVRFTITTPAAAAVTSHTMFFLPLSGLLWIVGRGHRWWPRSHLRSVISCAVVGVSGTLALAALTGCGGGYLSGAAVTGQSAAHTYPITLTATTTGVTGSALVHTASVTLAVN